MSKKIGSYYARTIGERVASKALEHEFTSLKEAADAATQKLHDTFFTDVIPAHITKCLQDHNALTKSRYFVVHVGEDAWGGLSSESYDIRPFLIGDLHLQLPEHIELFNQAILPAITCRAKIQKLSESIAQQIMNKTAQRVCKAWPEVAPFIRDVMGEEAFGAEMIVPFENMLKQFLALPAPVPVPAP